MNLRFACLLLLLSVQSAQAANWVTLRKGSGPTPQLQYDDTGKLRKDTVITVWSKLNFSQDFEIPDAPPLRARVILSQTSLNCATRTETTKRVLYLADDDPQSKLIERGPFDVNDIIPDSPQELLLNKLCSKK